LRDRSNQVSEISIMEHLYEDMRCWIEGSFAERLQTFHCRIFIRRYNVGVWNRETRQEG